MSGFICPICGENLIRQGKSYKCENRHNFDCAKSGYVNLLMSQQRRTKIHGDDKSMVRARKEFLDRGYYNVLLKAVLQTVEEYIGDGDVVLDSGCGECWYTAHIYECLHEHQINPTMLGIDISKHALDIGAKRNSHIQLAVASAFDIPVKDDYCDLVLSLFAPFSEQELKRVLKERGIFVRVFPLEKHLWSLKKIVYEAPYLNDVGTNEIEGFEILKTIELRDQIHITCNEDVINLFSMTPYYYKTSRDDQRKLYSVSDMYTEIEFEIVSYRKL